MGVITDVARYLAFAILLVALLRLVRELWLWRLREVSERDRRLLQILVALLSSALVWVGLVVAIAPITGVLSLELMLVLLLVPVIQLALGWAVAKVFRVRSDEKTSAPTAMELIGLRHPRIEQVRLHADGILLLLLLIAGAAVLIIADDRETAMFRLTFGLVFACTVPLMVSRALMLMSPVLDANSRDAQLAAGITAMVIQVIALGLLLSSLEVQRTEIPLGIADASLTISLPFLALVVGYFVLATAVPYAIGVRRALRLQKSFIDEEEKMRDGLTKLLLLPRTDLYAPGLAEARGAIESRLHDLEEDYFYVRFRRASPEHTTAAIADAIEAGDVGGRRFTGEPRDKSPLRAALALASGEASAAREEPAGDPKTLPVLEGEALGMSTIAEEEASAQPGEIEPAESPEVHDEAPSYAEFAQAIADEHGWPDGHPRREMLRTMAHLFETQARHADPALIHYEWLQRVRGVIDSIDADLQERETRTDAETAAHHWSHVVKSQTIELADRLKRGGGKPGAVVALTALGGLLVSALVRAAGSEVWQVFSGG